MKKKLTDEQKAILIYSGELMLFAVIFIVLGTLRIVGIIGYNQTRRIVFNYITLAGVLWGFIDFFWALFSKKRRQKVCILDKIIVLPLLVYMLVYDLVSLIMVPTKLSFYSNMLGSAMLIAAGIFIFMSIYHYFKPLPQILEEVKKIEEEEKEETKE